MNGRKLERLKKDLGSFIEPMVRDFKRVDQRGWAAKYLRGLLLDGDRKSIEPMARRLEEIDRSMGDIEQSLQQFIDQSPWDERLVRRRLADWANRTLVGNQRFLIVDGVGFPKQGKHSVGVARQYSGTLGKVGNCQVAVTLQLASEREVIALDAELYLPACWTEDSARCHEAKIPEGVTYQPKWGLCLNMIDRARESGLDGIVLADAEFGSVTEFRQRLESMGLTYVVGVESTLAVIDADLDLGEIAQHHGPGRPITRPQKVREGIETQSVKEWGTQHASRVRWVTWREGSKGKLRGRFAAWRVRTAHKLRAGKTPSEPTWLIAEYSEEGDSPAKYFLSNMPATSSLVRLVRSAKSRWIIERSYEEMKGELGLDHFEGRRWRGWHHHVTLVFVAYAFLIAQRRKKTVWPA